MKKLGYLALILSLFLPSVACTPTHKVKTAVIQLSKPQVGYCSGIQIQAPSGKEYILTAGHCHVLASNGSVLASANDSRPIARKVMEESPTTDLLLLEGLPNVHGIPIAANTHLEQHFRAFTHGAVYKTYKAEGELIQEQEINVLDHFISNADTEEMCTAGGSKYKVVETPFFIFTIKACVLTFNSYVTTVQPIVPGSSGGGVVDDNGDLVAIVSAGNDKFSYLVTLEDIQDFLSPY